MCFDKRYVACFSFFPLLYMILLSCPFLCLFFFLSVCVRFMVSAKKITPPEGFDWGRDGLDRSFLSSVPTVELL